MKTKRRQNPLDKNFDIVLTFVMTFILSLPIITYFVNQSTGKSHGYIFYNDLLRPNYSGNSVYSGYIFVNGFLIAGAICVLLVLYKFVTLIIDYSYLGVSGMLSLLVRKNTEYCLFGIYLIWIFISVAYHGFTEIGVYGLSFKYEGLITFSLYIFIFFAASFVRNPNCKIFLAFVFGLGAMVLSFLGTLVNIHERPAEIAQQVMIDSFMMDRGLLTFKGVFPNINHHGYYLAMAASSLIALAVFIKNYIWKIIFFLGFVSTVYIVFPTNSFGALLSIAVAILFLAVVYGITKSGLKPKIISATVIIVPIIAFTIMANVEVEKPKELNMVYQIYEFTDQVKETVKGNADDSFGTLRLKLWKATLGYIAEKPIFGWDSDGVWYKLGGVTKIVDYNTGQVATVAQRTHNEYLQQTAFYGIVAGLSYVLGCFMVYWRAFRNRRTLHTGDVVFLVGAFAYLVGAFFGVSMVQVYPIFIAILGLAVTNNYDKQEIDSVPDVIHNS